MIQKRCIFVFITSVDKIMNKIVGIVLLLFCFSSCVKDNDTIYYPVGDVDIERGNPDLAIGEEATFVARCDNEEDYVLDTIAQYPNDPTIGKLTFMINLKNQKGNSIDPSFNGIGKSGLTMSLGYKDGNYPLESQIPIFTSEDVESNYLVTLRLKGEITLSGEDWMIDYVYAQLAGLFHPYPPMDFPEVFMCKGGMKFGTFDSFRRTCTFDIKYDRADLSFSQLYFNLFVNLAGQTRENKIHLRIDKESFFEIYKQK